MMLLQALQRRAGCRAAGQWLRGRALAGQVGHVGAVAHAPLHIALGIQLVEGAGHGIARHPEQRRQVAAGRQPRAPGQAAVEDALAQGLVQLARQALGRVEADAGEVDG